MLRKQFPASPLHSPDEGINLGWREWIALPGLGIVAIKAKLDTGARSSSLHVEALETYEQAGVLMVRFSVRVRRRNPTPVVCTAPVLDRRTVTDSGGHRSERWFIRTQIALAGLGFSADINLTDRRAMLFPLLVGRSALAGRFRIDSALSYSLPRPLSSATPTAMLPS